MTDDAPGAVQGDKPTAPAPGSEQRGGDGKPAAGAHLQRRIDRNSKLTEQAQNEPGGGAHSGTPDPTNP